MGGTFSGKTGKDWMQRESQQSGDVLDSQSTKRRKKDKNLSGRHRYKANKDQQSQSGTSSDQTSSSETSSPYANTVLIKSTYQVCLDSPNCFHMCIFDNIIYITDSLHGMVKCFDTENGNYLSSIELCNASKDLAGISVLQLSKNEQVMVVGDTFKRQLVACKLITPTTIENESVFGSFQELCGLATDFVNRIFVADVTQGKIFVYKIDESLTFELVYEISELLDFPWYICYDDVYKRLFVSEPPERRITVFTENGEFLFQLFDRDLHLTQPFGVAVDSEGGIIITDRQDHTVVRLDNNSVKKLKTDYHLTRLFNGPFDVCVAQNGIVIVLDFNGTKDQSKRIQGFEILSYDETDINEMKLQHMSACSCFLDLGNQGQSVTWGPSAV